MKNFSINRKIDLFLFFKEIWFRKKIIFFITFLSAIIAFVYGYISDEKAIYLFSKPRLSYETIDENFPTQNDNEELNRDLVLLLESKSFLTDLNA